MLSLAKYPLIIVLMSLGVSCGPNYAIDLGKLAPVATAWPRILDVRYIGQSPVAQNVILLEIDYDDADGDLYDGTIDILFDGKGGEAAGAPLRPLLLQGENAPDARSGTFVLPVQLILAGSNAGLSQSTTFEISLQLTDALGHKSNMAKVQLMAEPTPFEEPVYEDER
jgi:hypothetical protein